MAVSSGGDSAPRPMGHRLSDSMQSYGTARCVTLLLNASRYTSRVSARVCTQSGEVRHDEGTRPIPSMPRVQLAIPRGVPRPAGEFGARSGQLLDRGGRQ